MRALVGGIDARRPPIRRYDVRWANHEAGEYAGAVGAGGCSAERMPIRYADQSPLRAVFAAEGRSEGVGGGGP
jgi:hypothetical protein